MMFAVAATEHRALPRRMAQDPRPIAASNQLSLLGNAIRALRERGGLTQIEAAAEIGVSRQAWHNYEAGNRKNILREDLQDDIARALGLTRQDLLRERDRLTGRPAAHEGVSDLGRTYELPVLGRVRACATGPQIYDTGASEQTVDVSWMFGVTARTLRVAGDSMTGYVESGDLVIYDTSQWPSRGDGCVIELTNGDIYVKEYINIGQGVLKVRQRLPDEELSFPMNQVRGVYTVRLRGS